MGFHSAQSRRDARILKRFGKQYAYTSLGDEPRLVTGLFEEPTRRSGIGERPMAAMYPMISVLRSEAPNLRSDDQFDIDGNVYRVKSRHKDVGEIIKADLEKLS